MDHAFLEPIDAKKGRSCDTAAEAKAISTRHYLGFLVVVVQKQHLVTFSFTPGVVRPHDGWEDTFGRPPYR